MLAVSDHPTISERIEPAPWWLPCVMSFAVGVAITAAVLMPVATTPDYQRGHSDGFKMGRNSEAEMSRLNEQRLYEAGIAEGRRQALAVK
jgi:hypothetical protein